MVLKEILPKLVKIGEYDAELPGADVTALSKTVMLVVSLKMLLSVATVADLLTVVIGERVEETGLSGNDGNELFFAAKLERKVAWVDVVVTSCEAGDGDSIKEEDANPTVLILLGGDTRTGDACVLGTIDVSTKVPTSETFDERAKVPYKDFIVDKAIAILVEAESSNATVPEVYVPEIRLEVSFDCEEFTDCLLGVAIVVDKL